MSRRLPRIVRSSLALAATAILAGVVHAQAPPGQYDTFDRTSTCIADVKTNLTWLRSPIAPSVSAGSLSFSAAATQCAALGSGWRVPSVNELETLVDDTPHQEIVGGQQVSKAIDAYAFPATPVDIPYWTSSVVPTGGSAWVVYFKDGSTTTTPFAVPQYVRCVKAGHVSTTVAPCIPSGP